MTWDTLETWEKKIQRAKVALILDAPFFGQLSHKLTATPMPQGAGCDTMATDGVSLYCHPPFVEKTPVRLLTGVVAHEIMHCVLGHHTRRGGRDKREWNIAADYAVNAILLQEGYRLPEGALFDKRYANKSAEEIYAIRQREKRQGKPQQGQGQPAQGQGQASGQQENNEQAQQPGEIWDCPSGDTPGDKPNNAKATKEEMAQAQQSWDISTMQAAQAAKVAGKLPGFVSEAVKGIRKPQVDWRDALRRYMTASVRDDYSWRRPNTRHLASDLYLPALHSESLGDIVIAVDTSGSISQDELALFAAEINSILDTVPPKTLHVVYCDAEVSHVDEYRADDRPITLTRHGGGGTAFAPVWDWVAESDVEPTCAVYLTDLCCSDFGKDPGYPVLWVSTLMSRAPFGEVVNLAV